MVSVNGPSAMASEPRYISPSPWPIASGGPLRAPIIRSSSPAKMNPSAKAPRSCDSDAFTASTGLMPLARYPSTRCSDDFGVGFGLEDRAVLLQLLAQFAKILDDAVVDHGDPGGCMRMGVVLVRLAVRGPAGMTDAGVARQRCGPAAWPRGFSACLRRGGDRDGRLPVWRRLRNRNRDTQGA